MRLRAARRQSTRRVCSCAEPLLAFCPWWRSAAATVVPRSQTRALTSPGTDRTKRQYEPKLREETRAELSRAEPSRAAAAEVSPELSRVQPSRRDRLIMTAATDACDLNVRIPDEIRCVCVCGPSGGSELVLLQESTQKQNYSSIMINRTDWRFFI